MSRRARSGGGRRWRRSAEPWYPDALAAEEEAEAGDDSVQNRGYMSFFYSRWDDAAHATSLPGQ